MLSAADNSVVCRSEVPGCNLSDLVREGYIPDLFIDRNERYAALIARLDWIFSKTFSISADFCKCPIVRLVCDKLDTVCDVFVNDTLVGKSSNAHMQAVFDIKNALHEGENHISIRFYSPVEYYKEQTKKFGAPLNPNGPSGIVHIRKPQSHFGWDWGPNLPLSGITGNIRIEGFYATIDDLFVHQHHFDGKVRLEISASLILPNQPVDWRLTLTHPNGRCEEKTGRTADGVKYTFEVSSPELWWTRDLANKFPLYYVELSLGNKAQPLCRKGVRLGLRTLQLDRGCDKYGSNFRFVINGVPIFAKGASTIPYDSLEGGKDKNRAREIVDAAMFANMNMLRAWGGGNYGDNELYDLCDENGILVWQDFGFACQPYPFFDKEFADSVLSEVEYNVKRLRNHPSLAVWCGNNELESMAHLWRFKPRWAKSNKSFFYELLPSKLKELDAVAPYIPTSPCGSDFCKDVHSDGVGDTHIWAVWHGFQPPEYYISRNTRFCSEFGFESFPDESTLDAFGGELSFKSKTFAAHQKSRSGNEKTVYYIARRFRLPARFNDYVYLSQLNQAEHIRQAVEYWRQNKGHTNGALYWQLNDCWPTCSWSSVDYFGNFKALHYFARKFFAPLSGGMRIDRNRLRLYCCNDTMCDATAQTTLNIFDFNGKTLFCDKIDTKLHKGQSVQTAEYALEEIPANGSCVAVADVLFDNGQRARSTILFAAENKIQLPKPTVVTDVKIENGNAVITLKTDKYARFVRLSHSKQKEHFSDNFFDLLPNEPVTIIQATTDLSAEEYADGLRLTSLADVQPKNSRAYDVLKRIQIMLNPINLGEYLFYSSSVRKKKKARH